MFVYMMNAPHKDVPAKPSKFYLDAVSYTHLIHCKYKTDHEEAYWDCMLTDAHTDINWYP